MGAATHRGAWFKQANGCFEIRGKTLGVIGYGHIGAQVSVLAESMGMKVIYCDVIPRLPMGNATQVSFEELLVASDFVTLHVPNKATTKDMMGAAEFAKMKQERFSSMPPVGTLSSFRHLPKRSERATYVGPMWTYSRWSPAKTVRTFSNQSYEAARTH